MSDMDSMLPPLEPGQRSLVNKWTQPEENTAQEQPQVYSAPEQSVQEETPEIQREPIKEAPQESTEDKNFKILRDKAALADRLAREHEIALQKIREFEYMNQAKNVQPEQVEQDDMQFAPDDLAEGKHLNQLNRKLRHMEKELKNYKQQSADMTAEARLRAQYPDFDSVVTAENLSTLRMIDPEIAETLQYSPDLYKKAVAAYKIIKDKGIDKQDNFMANKEKAEKNYAKPRPLTSVSPQHGESPLTKANAFANGLTPELEKQLRKEMQQARKSI